MKAPITKTYSLAALLSLGLVAASQGANADCVYKITNQWNTGLTGEIVVTNNTSSAINGWTVGWQYATNRLTGSWNANLSGNNPYSASNMGWNGNLPVGQSATFGFQVDKRGGSAEIPTLTGSICSGSQVSSSAPTTSSSSSSSSIAVISSSSSPNGQQCNWYGTLFPLCVNTQSGWGWENNKSCISRSTCTNIVGGSTSSIAPSSSSRSSIAPSSSSVATTSSVAPSSRSSIAPSSSSVATTSSIAPSSRSSVAPSSSSTPTTSSSVPSSSSSVAPSSRSSSSVSSVPPGVRMDNPFVGAQWYVDPIWSTKAMAENGGSKIAGYNTAVWMDRIGAIAPTDGSYGLRDHLDAALAQNANVIQVVVYDLPNRDCHALASNGELKQGVEGTTRYRTEYVDAIASIFSDPKYRSLRIIAIIEPDSLPNLVTNLSDPDCQLATDATHGYAANTRYTLSKLYPITNVYSYVDIGHSGWLGWTDNFGKAVTLIGDTIKSATGGVNSVAGFVSNTSGYTPLYEPFLDSLANSAFPGSGGGTQTRQAAFYEWNPHFSEVSFVQAWRTAMISAGFPSTIGMLVDTSRNGWGGANRPTAQSTSTVLNTFIDQSRIDRRTHRGNWCNQRGGIGERPQVAPVAGVDAYVWVKPPGESDGAASLELSFDPQDPAKGFDRMCDPTYNYNPGSGTNVDTGALPGAPVAGRWFKGAFEVLLQNAYPPLQ
ncbi:MAG: glycoside hydrolase family 6 protein [Cellvibrio sp.]|uniref:glycoside hydrolase family 6 protein n=1 Tax=Cellvibrio sp. TaxID=1965322 RepID=UPI0027185971|nr:glycoside hydrolase family 6 protein [Cellvibrio sp.]